MAEPYNKPLRAVGGEVMDVVPITPLLPTPEQRLARRKRCARVQSDLTREGPLGADGELRVRNRQLYKQGQNLREEIRIILLGHCAVLPTLTAKDVQRRLVVDPLPSVRTVQWHIQEVRDEEQNRLRSAQFKQDSE